VRRAPGHKRRGARAEPVGGAVRIQQQGAALDQEELVGAWVDMQRRAGFPGRRLAEQDGYPLPRPKEDDRAECKRLN